MKALLVHKGKLIMGDRPCPEPGDNEIRIKVKAAGVNRPDVFQRKGNYPAPSGVDPDIPGLEVSGIVDKVHGKHLPWQKGQPVCALVAGGGYAEYVVVDSRQVLPIPGNLTFMEAAGLCETYFTVWSNVVDRGKYQPGETVLIHGGSSGIGVSGIQLVKAMGGRVIVTAGTMEKCEACLKLGADMAINYKEKDFETEIRENNMKADIILDMVGGDYTAKNIRILKEDGRLVMINAMQGRHGEVDLLRVMVNRLTITGSTLRARDARFKGLVRDALLKHVWPLLISGEIYPVIHQVFPLEKGMEAHQVMEQSAHIGKIILQVE